MPPTKSALSETLRAQVGRRHYVPKHRVPHWGIRTDLVDPVLAFGVVGIPATEGSFSIQHSKNGKAHVVPADPGLDDWREAVRRAARQVTGVAGWAAITEPVVLSATFTLPNTAAADARGDTFYAQTPDLDKLIRAVGDSLIPRSIPTKDFRGLPTAVAKRARATAMAEARKTTVLHDDNLIVGFTHSVKMYAGATDFTPSDPGVLIEVWLAADLFDPLGRGAIAHATVSDVMTLVAPRAGWPAILSEVARSGGVAPAPILLAPELGEAEARTVASLLFSEGPQAEVPLLAIAA